MARRGAESGCESRNWRQYDNDEHKAGHGGPAFSSGGDGSQKSKIPDCVFRLHRARGGAAVGSGSGIPETTDREADVNRGGKRKGAGRKPAPAGTAKVPMTIKVEPELREYLRSCENATEAIETALKRSKAFRDWKPDHSG